MPSWLAPIGAALVVLLVGSLALWRLLLEPVRRRAETAVRERADALRSVLSAVDQVVYRTDPDGRLTLLNPAWENITGIPVAEALGQSLPSFIDPEDAEYLLWGPGRTECHRELRLRGPDGNVRWLEWRARLIPDPKGGVLGSWGTLLDVTERYEIRKAMETQSALLAVQSRELAGARETAQSSVQVRSGFLASMSHEIRTPLNGLLGTAGLLLNTRLDQEQRDFASAIHHSAESLLAVINDILDYTRLEAGQLSIEPLSFDLRVALEEVVEQQAGRAGEKGLELSLRLSPDLPRYVIGDAGRVRQILRHLVDNAVKFTHLGQVLLRVSATGTESARRVRLTVEDTGIGIPADRLDRIFDHFASADIARNLGGTGLGLAISRRLAELMGGTIGVESRVDQGSTFWVELPLAPDPAARQAVPSRTGLVGLPVLVVEPDATGRLVFCEQLSDAGLRADSAASGEETLSILGRAVEQGEPMSLVLIAARLPDMDGEALGRLVKSDSRLASTVLVYLATSGQPGDARRVHQAGFAAYLVKPLRNADLLDALAHAWHDRDAEHPPLVTRHSLAEARAAARENAPARQVAPAPAQTARVLLVEDNAVNQRLAARLLEKLECRADIAANGREALIRLAAQSYDLVFMDCQMPELDGYETTRLIRGSGEAWARIPVIAMTANAMRGDREKCLAAGMDDYLSKPIKADEFGRMVAHWLKASRDKERTPESFDLEALDELKTYDPSLALLAELCRLFLQETPRRIEDLCQAIKAGDASRTGFVAHALKGSCWILGARRLGVLASELERQGQAGTLERAEAQLAELRREFELLRPVYEGELETALSDGARK